MNLSPDRVQLTRLLHPPQNRSFLLFAARGVGKSTWIKNQIASSIQIDLLHNETFIELATNPSHLEARVKHLQKGEWITIDEIQKIPALLSEVHRLIENQRLNFALSGSSARKLKAGGADLLAGRALTLFMEPLSFCELGEKFDLNQALLLGGLPLVYLQPEYGIQTLSTYLMTYLKEEIQEEGLVRKLPPFLRFLEIMGLFNAQQINGSAIAREAKIARSSVDGYLSILQDTLVGFLLPAFQSRSKVREVSHPKFYWFDSGVARACAHLLPIAPDSQWLGSSLETWIYHELRVYNHIQGKMRRLSSNFY